MLPDMMGIEPETFWSPVRSGTDQAIEAFQMGDNERL